MIHDREKEVVIRIILSLVAGDYKMCGVSIEQSIYSNMSRVTIKLEKNYKLYDSGLVENYTLDNYDSLTSELLSLLNELFFRKNIDNKDFVSFIIRNNLVNEFNFYKKYYKNNNKLKKFSTILTMYQACL